MTGDFACAAKRNLPDVRLRSWEEHGRWVHCGLFARLKIVLQCPPTGFIRDESLKDQPFVRTLLHARPRDSNYREDERSRKVISL